MNITNTVWSVANHLLKHHTTPASTGSSQSHPVRDLVVDAAKVFAPSGLKAVAPSGLLGTLIDVFV